MLLHTLTLLFVITFVINAEDVLKCAPPRARGKAEKVNLKKGTTISFPTTGVVPFMRAGASSSVTVEFDAIELYSRKDHIMSLYLTVSFAPKVGTEGSLELAIEHAWETGCSDFSEDGCSKDIPADTFPLLRFCEATPFTATGEPIQLQLETKGQFLFVTHEGKFVGKAAIPNKDCDLQNKRQKINGMGIPKDGFEEQMPFFCQ